MKLREVSYLVLAIIVAEFVIVFPVLFPKHQDTPAIAESTLRGPQNLTSHRASASPAKPQVARTAHAGSANEQHAVSAERPRSAPLPLPSSKPVSARFAIAERTEVERPRESVSVVAQRHAPPPQQTSASTPAPAHVAVAVPKHVAVAAPTHVAVAAPTHVTVAVIKHVAVAVPAHAAAVLSSSPRKPQESGAVTTQDRPTRVAFAPRSEVEKPQAPLPKKTQHASAPTRSPQQPARPQNAPRVEAQNPLAKPGPRSAAEPRVDKASEDTRLALRESAPVQTFSNVPSRIASRPNPAENAIYQFDATATHLVRGQKTFLCVGVDPGVTASIAGVGRIAAGRTSCHRIAPQHSTTYVLSVARNGVVAERTLHVSVKQSGRTPPSRAQRPKVKHFFVPE